MCRVKTTLRNKLRKRHILVERAKESTEKSKLLKKIVSIYQLRIGTKSVFEFHNYRSVLFHGI
jgi:hypothetical protein